MTQARPAAAAHVPQPLRCADSARMRAEPLQASAVRYRRFLLLEVPGPWGRSALDDKVMDGRVAQRLGDAAKASDTHVILIRRPGRHPSTPERVMAWAFADVSPASRRVLWGSWREAADLLSLDLEADIPGEANAAGPQRLALVCTNGKRDQCCAIHGRPVAAALAASTGWDTWECSHLGGHRFAATMMLLPTGDMFGWLDSETGPEVVRRFDAGELKLSHYRGRAGQSFQAQAALYDGAVRLGDFRRDALRAISVRRPNDDEDLWEVDLIHQTERNPGVAYRVVLSGSRIAPSILSCSDTCPKAETRYETVSFSRIP
jgi:hypothetical protein